MDKSALRRAFEGAAYVCIDEDDTINVISELCDPQDIFSKEQLSDWALANGYVKVK